MRLYHALLVTAVALRASNVSAGATDCAMTPLESAPRDSFDGFDSSNDSPVQQTNSDVDANQEVSSPSGSEPKDSYDGFDSSNDSPVQQTNSDVNANQEVSSPSGSEPKDSYDGFDSSNDSPVQQTNSDVNANQESSSYNPVEEGSASTDALLDGSYSGFMIDVLDCGASEDSAKGASKVGTSQNSSPDSPVPDASVNQDFTTATDVDANHASASDDDNVKQGIVIPETSNASSNDDISPDTDVAGEFDAEFQTAQVPTAATTAPTIIESSSSSTDNSNTTLITSPSVDNSKLCTKPRVVITDVDVGAVVDSNEDEVALKVVAIAALPSGGSRIAFHSGDNVIVRELDANDKLVSSSPAVKVPLHDFADIHADKNGFVILGTRDAEGGGTLNCGNPSNLCGSAPNPAVPCYDMYMARYDGTSEKWATKLTSSSASLPPYSTSKTGEDVYMIWWYAHHGRIAFDGTNWAAYFGAAISTSEGGCINIHQGDRMKVVSPSGTITADQDSFDWGCSHSAYERITYDNRTDSYATICKTDNNNRIMPPKDWGTTIYPVDLGAANLGDIVPDSNPSSKKYWATASNGSGDKAKVHLIHFAMDAAASEDITLGGTDANERAPHLASIGNGGMLAVWEGSSASGDLVEGSGRTMYAQVLDASTGKAISEKVTVDKSVVGNRYQALKTYPDGSVAYLSKGKTNTSLQVVRFFGC